MSISVSSVRRAGLQRVGDPRHRAGKAAIGHLGNVHDGLDAGLQAEGLVLRHEDLGADHVVLVEGEHEGAAGRIGLHQAADVDVALGDDAVERRHDALIDLLLVQDLELRLLGDDVGCAPRRPWLPAARSVCSSMVPCCSGSQPCSTTGLSRSQVTLRQLAGRLALLQRRPELRQRAPRPGRSDDRARAPRSWPAAGPAFTRSPISTLRWSM